MIAATEVLEHYQSGGETGRFHTTVISDAFKKMGAEVCHVGRFSKEADKSTFKLHVKFGCHEAFAFYASGGCEHLIKPTGLKMYNLLNAVLRQP